MGLLGKFMCQAQNEAGINTYTYEILVYAPPSFENTTLNQTTVKAISAKNFSIDCPVNAYPPPDVSKMLKIFFVSKYQSWA